MTRPRAPRQAPRRASDLSEGDVNATPRRARWQEEHLSAGSRDLLARDAEVFLRQSLSSPCLDALKAARGEFIVDLDGREFLDFHGNSVHQTGHGHPRVLAALRRQLTELPFCPRRFTNEAAVTLAERLTGLQASAHARADSLPGPPGWKLLLAPGGTLAVGMALKLARMATGRFKFVSFWGAFHGASLDAVSVSGEAVFRKGAGPLLPNCEHVPAPDPSRCLLRPDGDCWACGLACARYLEAVFEHEGDVAALIAEPMRCTTAALPPVGYWEAVRDICDRHGALLIFDEIPLSLGRTGTFFAWENFGVVPDILVLGKGLGGGVMPLAAMLARSELDLAERAALGHYTHEKSPLACAAALATLEVIEEEGLVRRSRKLGSLALKRLQDMRPGAPGMGPARGLGLQIAVDVVRPHSPDLEPDPDLAEAVLYRCLSQGLSFKVSAGNVLTLAPPLNIAEASLTRALDIIQEAFHHCAAQ